MTAHRNPKDDSIHQSKAGIVTIVPVACSDSVCQEDLSTRIISRLRVIPCAGILLAMLSGVFFATAGFIVKLIPNINPIQIVVSR